MISPSENAVPDGNPAATGTMWKENWRTGSVLPLEFKAIDHPLRRKTDWMGGDEEEFDARDSRLREEFASLEVRYRAQTQQLPVQLTEARVEARLEARSEWEIELNERIATECERITGVCTEFAKARASYFMSVEEEVVRLALAIAARVLNREAKLDPLLLGAVVRMALEKVAEDSGAVLHVPIAEVESWRTMLSTESESVVTVVGEERMAEAECFLETSVGRVELGVVAQMEEIEKGFFDLLQQRPL
ncbi:FliH/SctL family protein [Granulicella arctica]|uniref:FliH/SctL family protein n=1 Tax=Granulicella arctica TaxID=940613 RepID=UPI0021E050EC|nr:FliH/SctL family protein [Granulicella arctica]